MQPIIPAPQMNFPHLEMSDDLRAGMAILDRATNHSVVASHRYEMYRAIARDADFVARINMTSCASGLNTVRGALVATLVISLAALFDQSRDATSLHKVLNPFLSPANAAAFAAIHHTFFVPIDSDRMLSLLRRLRFRLSRNPLKGAIERLRDLRHQDVAHLDLNPAFPKGPALTSDIDLVYAVSANVIVKCNRFCGLDIRASEIRANARSQAHTLCQSVLPSPMSR
jgi:AbiU2